MNALLLASWFGHRKVVQMLVSAGAKVTCENKSGLTVLHCAAQRGHAAVMQFIIEDLEDLDIDKTTKLGQTALHLTAEEGQLQAVEYLLSCGSSLAMRDKDNNSPLHLAAGRGHLAVVKKLLEAGAEMDGKNTAGQTSLHLAAEGGHHHCVQLLLSSGCDIDAQSSKSMTALHYAARSGHDEVAQLLIRGGIAVDAVDHHHATAMQLAVLHNFPAIVKLIIDADGDLDIADNRQQTPLHVAAEHARQDIAEMILISGVNLKLVDKQGKTSLDIAARGNHISMVDMIIKADRFYKWEKDNLPSESDSWVLKHLTFKQDQRPETEHMRSVLWRLSTQHLKVGGVECLAHHWTFTEAHILAIEQQWAGSKSYKEHGHRMLLIWLHGVLTARENPIKSLYEGLVGIDRLDLAESMRRKANAENDSPKKCAMT
ncbi:ankyrin repeat and death domain-containing protein 1B isoform X3 [Petromyzon marinus]